MNQALVLDYNDLGRIAGGIGAFKKLQVLRSSAKAYSVTFRRPYDSNCSY
jgi:hypothetical protein